MKGIALRYFEKFAPRDGTIVEHQKLLDKNGYVYYGKMGTPISDKNIDMLMEQDEVKVLLIQSGKANRYWVTVDEIVKQRPPIDTFPSYYDDILDRFATWFRIIKIETAPKGIMSKCKVVSSGAVLSDASKHSMSSFFIIEY